MLSPHVHYFFALPAVVALMACAQIGIHKEVISTKNAPAAIGPYSQAIRVGNMLFLAGQIPIDPKTNQLMATGTIEEQTKLVIENLRAILEANGMTLANVVSTQVFMKDLEEFPRMNAVYGTYFNEKPPARVTVEVARLPRDVKIEIAAIAAK
ncbi:MAG TPA: RidA family protein [Desulfosporosinus sp.]|nr:RidA family protein [Desulfosporosinus sp.]